VTDPARLLTDRFAADPGRAGLFCDFDGTLTPIVADPADSRLDEATDALLAGLARRLRVVAVVSGRPAAFLASRVGAPGVRLLGLYGLEQWRDGAATTHPEAAGWGDVVTRTRDRLARLVDDLPGVAVEDKGLSVAVHWRNAADRDAAGAAVAGLAARLAEETGLAREPGKLVEELRPPVEWDKGSAVRSTVDQTGLEHVAYVGDDRGDLPAFAATRAAGGLCLAVDHGEETPAELLAAADAVVDGQPGVIALLRVLRDALEGENGDTPPVR
jgi:trehalose 6-phosphate phosphatase